jgi:uncharacterized membrane protein
MRPLSEELTLSSPLASRHSAWRLLSVSTWQALSADDSTSVHTPPPASDGTECAGTECDGTECAGGAPQRIEIAPYCSLTVRGALWFFAATCAVSFTIAGVMVLLGFWPIFPFAGLEMAVLAWALKVSLDRRRHRQTITVSDRDVLVESCSGPRCVQVVFPRHWARVTLHRSASRLYPSRLVIESHGRQCEVGDFLTEEERRGLAHRLSRLIGRIDESPTLV